MEHMRMLLVLLPGFKEMICLQFRLEKIGVWVHVFASLRD